MSHFLKILSVFLLSLFGLILYAMHVLEGQLLITLPTLIQQSPVPITTGTVQNGSCWMNACAVIPNVVLHPAGQDSISLGTVSLSVPPLLPLRTTIQNTDSSFLIDLTLSGNFWDIRQLSGQIGSFQFDLSGIIQPKSETGTLTLHTTGLKTFLTRFYNFPPMVGWLFTDSPSTLTLTPHGGYLRLNGFPLFPILN